MVVKHLIHLFEIRLYTSGHAALRPEEIKNSFVVYRVSSLCADLWKGTTKDFARKNKTGQPFNYALVYPYYRQLLALCVTRTEILGVVCLIFIGIPYGERNCGQRLFNIGENSYEGAL